MNEDFKTKYEHLAALVTKMMDTPQLYFKTRNTAILKQSKALESQVREFIKPKAVSQAK